MMTNLYTYAPGHPCPEQMDEDIRQISPICLDILYRRGYQSSSQIRAFLNPDLQAATEPFCCQGIQPALELLTEVVRKRIPVVVYRDYDVDGISAGALVVELLRQLGVPTQHYANEREKDGFGICRNGIRTILETWPDTKLILTVDNGIAGADAISYAKSLGLSVIVTDHHMPDESLPQDAAAVIDLHQPGERYPFRDLCGSAVAFRVMLDLYRVLGRDTAPVMRTLDLVALATVGDVMPLHGQNRALVQEGLKLIRAGTRPFFRTAAKVLGISEVSAHGTLSYQYVPMLNALSRMGQDTRLGTEALLSRDEAWVEKQVSGFKALNEARKDQTDREAQMAEELAQAYTQRKAIVIHSDSFSDGIVGITAGRLKERHWKPAIVLASTPSGTLKGSGRSIDGFHLKHALDQCADLLLGYGGHAKAVGLSLLPEHLDAFVERFCRLAEESLTEEALVKKTPLDAVLQEQDVTADLLHALRQLEPYGEGFPEPLFGLTASPNRVSYMGVEKNHVKLHCPQSGLALIGWGKAEQIQAMQARTGALPQKFIGRPSLNVWNGVAYPQFICQELRRR